MNVLKNVTLRVEDSAETEVWVAILKTAVSFNSLNPFYDGFYYKNEIVISNMDRNQLRLQLRPVPFTSIISLTISSKKHALSTIN
ncbi:uncharacterized protein BDFB_014535 [Asbolus verrucosus]|uniref:PH domain-containing protein n=1 Tax=Asbolus verrucosus TaxID=1661398 RepID=A0A482VYA2_ASBVE|nr:uncharacterized protein BDFB_014535 [Asbolus verrucosus]